MIRETFPVGMLGCNCTVLGDEATREATVVDPGDDLPGILAVLARHQLTLRQIVITHAHIDHIAGAFELKRVTGAPVIYSKADLPLVALMGQQAAWLGIPEPTIAAPDHSPAHDEKLSLGEQQMTVLLTPGHSQGSLCLHLPDYGVLLAGDTLFAGSIGRTDLPGGNAPQLIESIRDHLLPLPDSTCVVPGHGPATTIGEERRSNPFLSAR